MCVKQKQRYNMANKTEVSLEEGEPHPMAFSAKQWIIEYVADPRDPAKVFRVKEAMASSAMAGNRTAEIVLSTLNRLLNSEPVSDRYVLGLAWFLRDLESSST